MQVSFCLPFIVPQSITKFVELVCICCVYLMAYVCHTGEKGKHLAGITEG